MELLWLLHEYLEAQTKLDALEDHGVPEMTESRKIYHLLNGIRCEKLNDAQAVVMSSPNLRDNFSATVTHFQDYINTTPAMTGLNVSGRHVSEMGSCRGGGRGRGDEGRGGRGDGRGAGRGHFLGRMATQAEIDQVIGRVREKYSRGDTKFYIQGSTYSGMITAERAAVRQIRMEMVQMQPKEEAVARLPPPPVLPHRTANSVDESLLSPP